MRNEIGERISELVDNAEVESSKAAKSAKQEREERRGQRERNRLEDRQRVENIKALFQHLRGTLPIDVSVWLRKRSNRTGFFEFFTLKSRLERKFRNSPKGVAKWWRLELLIHGRSKNAPRVLAQFAIVIESRSRPSKVTFYDGDDHWKSKRLDPSTHSSVLLNFEELQRLVDAEVLDWIKSKAPGQKSQPGP